jgi:hypothetical protein
MNTHDFAREELSDQYGLCSQKSPNYGLIELIKLPVDVIQCMGALVRAVRIQNAYGLRKGEVLLQMERDTLNKGSEPQVADVISTFFIEFCWENSLFDKEAQVSKYVTSRLFSSAVRRSFNVDLECVWEDFKSFGYKAPVVSKSKLFLSTLLKHIESAGDDKSLERALSISMKPNSSCMASNIALALQSQERFTV